MDPNNEQQYTPEATNEPAADTVSDATAAAEDFDDGPEDDGDEQPETDVAPSRRERRQGRHLLKLKQGVEEAQRALEGERRAREQLEAEIRRVREESARAAQQYQQSQQPDPAVEFNRQAEAMEKEMERELALAAEGKTDMRRYWQLQRQQAELIAEQRARQIVQETLRQQPDPQQYAMKAALEDKHPWLATNVQARQAADGYIQVLLSQGKPLNLSTYMEACAMAARDFGIGGLQAPTAASKARYAGVGSQEAGSREAESSAPISEDEMAIARAWANAYDRLSGASDEVVVRAWRKKVGRK